MSDINLNFTVPNNSINFTVQPNDITITQTPIELAFFNPGSPLAATSLNANISNVRIYGGTDGYVLQTDGTGNLNWSAMGGGGNGSPGGSNTQIQYNNSGLFGGNTGFTFNSTTGNLNVPGNLTIVGNISGNNITGNVATAYNVIGNNQSNINTVGTLTNLNVNGISSIHAAQESVNIYVAGATGTVSINLVNQAINYYTQNATANFTVNITGNSITSLNSLMATGQSMTTSLMVTNGTTGYYANVIQIDGANITPKWVGNVPVGGDANSIDVYTFNIIKTASSTYTVLGSLLGYK